jgi:hypothetical protein
MSAPHVNKSTPCAGCGHNYGDHCQGGRLHWDADEHLFSCIAQHCICGPCQCRAFVNPHNGRTTPWTRPALPETPCARCSHPKQHHCRKGSVGIIVDGVPHTCSHYLAYIRADFTGTPECSDTRCAEILDAKQETFCPCSRFKNPYLRPRQKRASKPMNLIPDEDLARANAHYLAQQQPRTKTKAEILVEVAREFAPCTVAELATAASMSQSWVRRTLRKSGITPAKPVRRKEVKA